MGLASGNVRREAHMPLILCVRFMVWPSCWSAKFRGKPLNDAVRERRSLPLPGVRIAAQVGCVKCAVPVAMQASEQIHRGSITVGPQSLHGVGGTQGLSGIIASAVANRKLGCGRQLEIAVEADF